MKKLLLFCLFLVLIILLIISLSSLFSLGEIKKIAKTTSEMAQARPFLLFSALVLSQALGMAFSLPTKALLTLLAGALIGPLMGGFATLIGVLTGTTALFFTCRYLLRDYVIQKLGPRAASLEEHLTRHPVRALIGLRLFISLPFAPITLASALTSMKYRDFIVGSFLGDLPVIIAYALAGRQLFKLVTVQEAVDPWTMIILLVAGIFIFITAIFGKKKESAQSAA